MSTTFPSRPTTTSRDRQVAMWHRAKQTLPGGADSNFRAWGEETVYIDRGEGARIWDLDGNEYIDLRMGYGTTLLGHGDARVDDHVAGADAPRRELQPHRRRTRSQRRSSCAS